jgi:transcriptional regulator
VYVPAHFAASDDDVRTLLRDLDAVDLVTVTPDGLTSTFLPMLFEPATGEHGALLGHVARNNPHWQHAGAQSLVIARGPDAYVSPNWYASKAEHGRVVPTWNYLSVQLHGRLVVHDDVSWLRDLVTRLTDRHEAGSSRPWAVGDAPETFVAGQLRAIVGVELVITRVEGKAKLSQNRSGADQAGVIAGLTERGGSDAQVAAAMTARPELA